MDICSWLKNNILLFDGAMGTYFSSLGHSGSCELANKTHPDVIRSIHQEYLKAGAMAIKTNTFACSRPVYGEALCRELIEAGYSLACECAGDALVFADIGPAAPEHEDAAAEYRFIAEQFLKQGAKYFLFETMPDLTGIGEAAAFIKSQVPDAFILVSFAAHADGFTQTGHLAKNLYSACVQDPFIDAAGFNCISSAGHMGPLADAVSSMDFPLSLMPNAGYPTVLGRQVIYQGEPEYFGTQLRELAEKGAGILGGCCGTTPAHIAAAAQALKEPLPARARTFRQEDPVSKSQADNPFWQALCDPAVRPVAVELDPPEAADVSKFMTGAMELSSHGASIITIADCPIARARMDSSLLACKLRRELQIEALPHMTCRDRNLNATKALLLGLCAEEVHNVLVVTGDPIPSASRDEVKSVYNFNSRMLARYITGLGETALPVPFHVFGALNLNVRNFNVQLQLAQKKTENGVCGFLTQPVLSDSALENLKQARSVLAPEVKILGGIFPVVSYRNAVYMNSEVSGITISPEIIEAYQGLDRDEGEALAVSLSRKLAAQMAPYVDGFYLITPFGRTGLIGKILDAFRQDGLI